MRATTTTLRRFAVVFLSVVLAAILTSGSLTTMPAGAADGHSHSHSHSHGDNERGRTPPSFDVVDGELLRGDSGTRAWRRASSIWSRFADIIPEDQRSMVVGFELLPRGNGAYVYPTDDDPTKWVLGFSHGMRGKFRDFVLIHEFAHLLTLRAEEVPPGGAKKTCPTYFTGEGCSVDGSIVDRFVDDFWPDSLLKERRQTKSTFKFWKKHKDEFVSQYAATNPAEDLAETFARFVTRPAPTGTAIADQKLNFFWSDPLMVALRNQINSAR